MIERYTDLNWPMFHYFPLPTTRELRVSSNVFWKVQGWEACCKHSSMPWASSRLLSISKAELNVQSILPSSFFISGLLRAIWAGTKEWLYLREGLETCLSIYSLTFGSFLVGDGLFLYLWEPYFLGHYQGSTGFTCFRPNQCCISTSGVQQMHSLAISPFVHFKH